MIETVREGLNDFLGLSGPAKPQAAFDAIQARCAELTPQECAIRLRAFQCAVAENLAARCHEDGYTVTKTWTRKGIRYFLAEREFMESLLSEDYEVLQPLAKFSTV